MRDPDGQRSDLGGATVRLDGQAQNVAGFDGRPAIAGIRPETRVPGAGDCALSGVVEVVEPTGPDTIVLMDVAGQKLTVRPGAMTAVRRGESLSVRVDAGSVNLFDPDTGARI